MASKKMTFRPGVTQKGVINDPNDAINTVKATAKFKMQYIHRDKIRPNEKNARYSQDDLEALRDNILARGLYHNLVVIPEKDGYRLVSGERRWRAISLMSDEDYLATFPAGIPCKIQSEKTSDVDEEIDLISANAEVRSRSIQDNLDDVRRLAELYEIKRKNKEIRSIPNEISKRMGISERQVRKYMNVGKLIPELSEALQAKSISFEDASRFSGLETAEQMMLADILENEGQVTKEDYESIKKLSEESASQLQATQAELLEAEKKIEDKDLQIAQLEKMLAEANDANASAIKSALDKTVIQKENLENKKKEIAQRQLDPALAGMSKREIMLLRKKARVEKSLNSIIFDIDRLKTSWSILESDPELLVKFKVIAEKINELNEDDE